MIDYTKQCWYCGAMAMLKVDSYYACEKCGATWIEPARVGPPCSKMVEDLAVGYKTPSPRSVVGVGKRIKKGRKKDAINI